MRKEERKNFLGIKARYNPVVQIKNSTTGITLIALVITIIILLILAGASLSAALGDNGIIRRAEDAVFMNKYAQYKEMLELQIDKGSVTCDGNDIKNYIKMMEDEDIEDFMIINGDLCYIGTDTKEIATANKVGIDTSYSGLSNEIILIKTKILSLGKTVSLPSSDDVETPSGLLGKRLYDKNSLNAERWNIVIDYDNYNEETARYGSNYYLLLPGTYTVNGENIIIENNWVLKYDNETVELLSENYVEWTLASTLAVTDDLVLNIDPINLSDGQWIGISKYGDVEYDAETKALKFNEDSVNNPNGEGGYLELTRSGVDFTDGFTFEIYANLSRKTYDNSSGKNYYSMFCRIPSLTSSYDKAMRFGGSSVAICKFYSKSSWTGTGNILTTISSGDILTSKKLGYDINEDFYLTFVYTAYDSSKTAEYQEKHYDEKMISEGVDKVEYYINGELYGYTYYGHDSYQEGLATWNTDECPFFLGVAPWGGSGNLYYLKGSVYTTRLYTCSMTAEEVSANRNMTERYRESF